MTLHAVLFDFDGTLVDSEPLHLAIWNNDDLVRIRKKLDVSEPVFWFLFKKPPKVFKRRQQ